MALLCGLVGELLLSMHKTLGSIPWTTTIETCLNGSDVQPGLEVTLWVLGWITSPTPQVK